MSSRSRVAKKSKSLDAKEMAKSKSKRVYCLCKGPDDGQMMIACDACNDWFHVGCIGMTRRAASKLKSFTCAICSRKQNGDSIITLVKESETKKTKTKKDKKESKTTTAASEQQVVASPRRLAKRTRKGAAKAAAAAAKTTSTNKRRRKEEDEEEAENSSGHNESEVEDEDDDNEDEDEDDDEEKEEKEDGDDDGEEEEDNDEEESSYELERKRRMEENQRFLQSLGLLDVKKSLGMTAASGSNGTTRKYTGKRHRWSAGDAGLSKGDDSFEGDEEGSRSAGAQPVRKSRRLQNEPALDFAQIKMEVVQELAERPVVRRARGSIVAHARGFHGNGRVPDTEHIVAPFSLASVATTIWSLGHIYQGDASPEKYHSSKQCMYRHPYPVGYRASTVKWGSVWIMEIHEGRDGPLFVVRQKRDDEHEDGTPIHAAAAQAETGNKNNDEKNKKREGEEDEEDQESFTFADEEPEEGAEEKKNEQEPKPQQEDKKEKKKRAKTFKRSWRLFNNNRFEGPSATQPWTKACIDGPSPGSRISGPLVFGFSDPLTVHILNRLQKNAAAALSQ